jgi:hypothetical protein
MNGPSDDPAVAKILVEIEDLKSRLTWERTGGRAILVVNCLVLAAGFVAGIFQYAATQREEFRRRFWEKKLDVYSAVAAAAGRIGTAEDSVARDSAYTEFISLYHGDFALIASASATQCAVEIRARYNEYRARPAHQESFQRATDQMVAVFRHDLASVGDIHLSASEDSVCLSPNAQ